MMETSTPTLDSIVYEDESSEKTGTLSCDDLEFYESLKPALNQLITNPNDDTVNCILNFSKTV